MRKVSEGGGVQSISTDLHLQRPVPLAQPPCHLPLPAAVELLRHGATVRDAGLRVVEACVHCRVCCSPVSGCLCGGPGARPIRVFRREPSTLSTDGGKPHFREVTGGQCVPPAPAPAPHFRSIHVPPPGMHQKESCLRGGSRGG